MFVCWSKHKSDLSEPRLAILFANPIRGQMLAVSSGASDVSVHVLVVHAIQR